MSLPPVRFSKGDDRSLHRPGFPIRAPSGQCLLNSSPRLFAASHALHRVSAPRHPPHALSSLPTIILESSIPLACIRFINAYDLSNVYKQQCQRAQGHYLNDSVSHLIFFGLSTSDNGADRDRTDDLRLAKAALSQLSYSPSSFPWWA